MVRSIVSVAAVSLFAHAVTGISLSVDNDGSVKSAASELAQGLMTYYNVSGQTGTAVIMSDTYYFWEWGLFFQTFVEYWAATGDSTYNSMVASGLLSEKGDNNDYLPVNETKSEGSDDQGTWALAAMRAAEVDFPNSSGPQWKQLAQNVLDDFIQRWDTETCRGGIRWELEVFQNGYDYKNSISNGIFFDLAARMALLTGNDTYTNWANKVYDWEQSIGFITSDFKVYDGAQTDSNCTDIDKLEFSMTTGVHLHGAATMYNLTKGSDTWKTRAEGLLQNVKSTFTKNSILYEAACEGAKTCSKDMQAYKGATLQAMADTVRLMPASSSLISPLLQANAQAAAKSCSGSPSKGYSGKAGTACGFSWTSSNFDGMSGMGEQMSGLSAVMLVLPDQGKGASGSSNSTSTPTSSGGSSTASGTASSASSTSTSGHGSGAAGVRLSWVAMGLTAYAFVALV